MILPKKTLGIPPKLGILKSSALSLIWKTMLYFVVLDSGVRNS
jgi:hypothetical protein